MKKLISILIILASFNCFSQTADTKTDSIQSNLMQFHKQYKAGVWLFVSGIAVAGSGGLIATRKFNSATAQIQNKNEAQVFIIIGSALAITGYIIQVDSHKFIARAGAGGVQLTYKF